MKNRVSRKSNFFCNTRRRRAWILPVIILTLCGCTPKKQQQWVLNDFALDTTVKLKIYGAYDQSILDSSLLEIRRLESILSTHTEDSEVSEINDNAGTGQWTEISAETEELLEASLYYGKLSEEKLNITAGPLISLWNISPPSGHVPSEEELAETLPLIDLSLLELEEGKTRLTKEGMSINLGALAKGYIADRCKDYLRSHGVESGLINLGGNILALGSKPGDLPFRIGIQDPLDQRGSNIGILEIRDRSMVTSGDYERFFIDALGNRYHHILDPISGFPSAMGLHQVTIVSQTSLEGDALSTTLFLMGLDKGLNLVENLEDTEAIFVTETKEVYCTSGVQESFQFLGAERGYRLVK